MGRRTLAEWRKQRDANLALLAERARLVRLTAKALRTPGIFVKGNPGIGYVAHIEKDIAYVDWRSGLYRHDQRYCGAPVETKYLKFVVVHGKRKNEKE